MKSPFFDAEKGYPMRSIALGKLTHVLPFITGGRISPLNADKRLSVYFDYTLPLQKPEQFKTAAVRVKPVHFCCEPLTTKVIYVFNATMEYIITVTVKVTVINPQDCAELKFGYKAHPPAHIEIYVSGYNAIDGQKDMQDGELIFSGPKLAGRVPKHPT